MQQVLTVLADLLGQGSVRRAVLAVGVPLASVPLLENLVQPGAAWFAQASAGLKGSR